MWGRTGACGRGSRPWAREAGPAQTRVARPHGREARVPEARPLRTRTEPWQAHPKARVGTDEVQARAGVRGRSGQKPPRGTPGCRHLLPTELVAWRPAPLRCLTSMPPANLAPNAITHALASRCFD